MRNLKLLKMLNDHGQWTVPLLSPPPVHRGRVRVGTFESAFVGSPTPTRALPRSTGGGGRYFLSLAMGVMLVAGITGCTDTSKPSPMQSTQLSAGYQALQQGQPQVAIDRADEYLREQPHGSGAAEALYLKGQGYEKRIAANPNESKRDWLEARTAYLNALNENPSPQLEGNIRAGLSNIAFHSDDFPTAYLEAQGAFTLTTSPQIQSMLLYRMGVSQQRMGRFTDADATFESVEQRYPGTPIAQQAHEHEGLRNFYVQLATFNTPAGAAKAMASLRTSGLTLSQQTDRTGHTVIDAGPLPSYEDAKRVKEQMSREYPDALIKP